MQPIGKYIVIEQEEEQIKTSSGLLLSQEDTKNFRYKKGVVIKEGTEVSVIKPNDEIYYDKRAGYTMMIDEKPCTIITERDVVIILNRTF